MQSNGKIVPISPATVSPIIGPTATGSSGQRSDRPAQPTDLGRYRLVIEEGPSAGTFVYKTLDRVTGEVVKQFPREQVVQLMGSDDYGSGSVIDTKI